MYTEPARLGEQVCSSPAPAGRSVPRGSLGGVAVDSRSVAPCVGGTPSPVSYPLMDPAFAARAFAAIGSRAYRDAFVAITARCPEHSFERLVGSDLLGERTLWDVRGVDADLGPSMAGAGVAALEFHGGGGPRFASLSARAQGLFRTMIEHRDQGCEDAPPPAFVGGAAFATSGPRDPEWDWFASELFILPRWRVALTGQGAFATWIVPVADLAHREALLEELATANDVVSRIPTVRIQEHSLVSREDVERRDWRGLVESALSAIHAGAFSKLVPARRTHVTMRNAIDPMSCLSRASRRFKTCTRFLVEREGRAFVGASPERLVRVRGQRLETDGLAGSLPRGPTADPAALARELLASEKNLREHRAVVDALRAALAPLSSSLEVPASPQVRTLPNLVHLWSPITATLREKRHPLELLAMLHPTPAVAGTPRHLAVDWLVGNEPHPRGWFAGPVGWFDARGDGAFVVGLRSMLVHGHDAWLYAGAGVVRGSDPDAEYAETEAKLGAMLDALGLEA
jgi:salicylate biosynthesis isochorismate synthase